MVGVGDETLRDRGLVALDLFSNGTATRVRQSTSSNTLSFTLGYQLQITVRSDLILTHHD